MPTENSEKIKLYIVIGLLIVAAITAYFRFVHKKADSGSESPVLPSQEVTLDTSHLQKTMPKKRFQKAESPVNETVNHNIRDIFVPVQLPATSDSMEKTDASRAFAGVLDLKGIIMGGKKPVVIINGKFMSMGGSIGEYRIIKIDSNEVVLQSGSDKKVLRVLTASDK